MAELSPEQIMDELRARADALERWARAEDNEYPEPDEYCSARGGDGSRESARLMRQGVSLIERQQQEIARLRAQKVTAAVSPIHAGEDGEGALESTDLYVCGRGVSLLVNVDIDGSATYALSVDKQQESSGWIVEKQPVGTPSGDPQ